MRAKWLALSCGSLLFPCVLRVQLVRFTLQQYVTQTARLILRERVDFARQQPDRNRQNRAATVDSCFVLIGTRQHGVAVLYETSDRASSNKMQQNPCPIKLRTLSSNKNETAVHGCSPVLSVSVGLLSRKVNPFT